MHLLTVVFGPCPTPWTFMFRKPELADSAFLAIETAKKNQTDSISLIDEFSQHATFNVADIHAFMLEDMAQSMLAHVEQGLHRARTQVKANQMAQADNVLKTAAMTQGSAPIFSPMGNGRLS